MSLYECCTPGTDKWVECTVKDCARERRINQNMDMVLRLEQYKMKLDAGQELPELERADLEAIGKHIAEVLESFVEAVKEAFKPIMETLAQVVHELWESLPEEYKVDVMAKAAPRLKLNPDLFGDRTAPLSVVQGRFPNQIIQSQVRRDLS